MKSKSTAGILSLFLGGLGVHRFYLGHNWTGFFYLIFCWSFIPAILAFVEAILFFTMSDDKFNKEYNKGKISGNINVSDELEKLHALMQKGILSEKEFSERKKALLA